MSRKNDRDIVSVEQLREAFKAQKFEMKEDPVDTYNFFVPKSEENVDEQKSE